MKCREQHGDSHSRTFRGAVALLNVFLFLAQSSHAAGTTSAAFLRLGSGARAAALGDSFVSRADDASATYWNPAGMSQLPRRELLAEHVLHVQDIAINRLAYVHPLRANSEWRMANGKTTRALGFSAAHLAVTGIEARSGNTARPDSTFGASDFYGALSYAHPLNASASLGLTGKLVQQRIGSRKTSFYAGDVGVLQTFGRFRLGAAAANLGPSVTYIKETYALPTTYRGGVSVDARPFPLSVSLEAEKLKGEPALSYRLGAEMDFSGLLALRMGYLARPGATQRALKGSALGAASDGQLSGLTGMSGGMGFRLMGYAVDYSFTPYGELGSSHKMSLTARF
jgi:hypothetical protein